MTKTFSIAHVLLAPLLVLSGGCYSSGTKGTEHVDWVLTGVDLDRSVLKNAGSMPLFRRPSGTNFGGAPVAIGSFRSADTGRAACRVVFEEPVVGPSGRVTAFRYEVVSMAGMRSEDGKRLSSGAAPGSTPLGAPTELRFDRVDQKTLVARAFTDATPLPYVFTFSSSAGVERPVEIPYVD
jgi:hypothetical protein